MRIAIVTEVWHPTINGVVTRLAATVDELLRDGHQVLIVAPKLSDGDGERDGLRVRTVPTLSVPFVYGGQPWGLPLPRVGRFLADFEPDVVHVVNPVLLGITGVLSARRHRTPLVCSYHTDVATYASFYRLGWLRPLIWRVVRALHTQAAINLVTSDVAAAQLRQAGIPRVRRWHCGVDLERFRPAAIDPQTRGSGYRTALYVGRLAAEKGLGALAELVSVPDVHLVIVGDGPARVSLTEQLRSGSVEFKGPLHGEELAAAYRQADVFVFPSTTETLGLVLLEALASGLPVVAAASPASREVLDGCGAARLWPAGSPGALPAAVSDLVGSASRQSLADHARRHVAGFGWSAATSYLVEQYRVAVAATPAPPAGRAGMQVLSFGAVGVSNAVIDLAAFNLLVALHPTRNPLLLVVFNTIAVILALINSYWWNSRWTFRKVTNSTPRWSPGRRRLLFAAQGGVNLAINDSTVAGVTAALAATDALSTGLAANVAKVSGMIIASAVSFAVMRLVVFRHRDGPSETKASIADPVARDALPSDINPNGPRRPLERDRSDRHSTR